MTEETKNEEIKQDCFCKSKCFRDFVKIALGSFIGVYCALSLFSAIHKPPMPCPMFHHMMYKDMMMRNGGFHHKMNFDEMRRFDHEHYKKEKDNLEQKDYEK